MTYEDNFLKKIDATFKPKTLLEDEGLLNALLKQKKETVDVFRPKLDDFIGAKDKKGNLLFTRDEIEKDKKEVFRLKEIFKQKYLELTPRMQSLYKVSQIFEGVIIDQAEANAWFGEIVEVIPASDFDDFKNGIDGIGVLKNKEENDGKYFGFGIDVTFASDNKILLSKLDSIKAVIRRISKEQNKNILPQAKYVVDENENYTSLFVPKVIIGARYSSAEKIIKLWGSKREGRNAKLQKHPIQAKMIMEILWQAHYFYNFALRVNNEEAAYAYAKLNNAFVDIFEEKRKFIEDNWDEIQDDIVFETIKEYTGNE